LLDVASVGHALDEIGELLAESVVMALTLSTKGRGEGLGQANEHGNVAPGEGSVLPELKDKLGSRATPHKRFFGGIGRNFASLGKRIKLGGLLLQLGSDGICANARV
jgi:hypothetical protein